MALTDAQVQVRIEELESKANEIQVALNNLATRRQLNASMLVRQKEITELQQLTTTLQSEIEALQAIIVDAPSGHGNLTGLTDDDHSQYHNNARGDTRYFKETEHVSTTAGVADAGKPIILDSDGLINDSMVSLVAEDHNTLLNLTTGDVHTQYFTTGRANTWFATKDLADLSAKSHTSLSDIGTNTHTQIDIQVASFITHSGDSTIHFIEAGIDHTSITNIGSNAHSTIDTHLASNHVNSFNSRTGTVTPADGDYTLSGLTDTTVGTVVSGENLQYNGIEWANIDPVEAFPAATIPGGTTATLDFAVERKKVLDLGSASGDVTLTLTNPSNGGIYIIDVIQGAVTRDVIWPGSILWVGGTPPVISTSEDDLDMIQLFYDGANYRGTFLQAFA